MFVLRSSHVYLELEKSPTFHNRFPLELTKLIIAEKQVP
jgi:hypothetical protein